MKLVNSIPDNYHIRLRDHNQRNDINIGVSDFYDSILKYLTEQGDFGGGVFNPDLDDNFLATKTVGSISVGTPAGDLRGKSFTEMWTQALFTPVHTSPTLSLSGSGNKLIQVGTTINPVLTGNYSQNSAGPTNSISLKRNGVEIGTTNPYTDTGLTSATPATFNYQMTINFDEGDIQAGSVISNTVGYNFIYPYFWGKSSDRNVLAADVILGNLVVGNSSSGVTINFNSTSSDYLWFAVPASVATFDTWFITALNNGSIGGAVDIAGNLFPDPTTVELTTVNWAGIDYKLYISNYSTAATLNMQIS